jgi:hypothetical protein
MGVAAQIANLLANDAVLAAVLTGGVWTRPLKREGPGATPEAFAPSGQVRPAAVVRDGGEAADGAGPDGAYLGYPQVFLYAPATANGRAALESAFARIVELLHNASVVGAGESGAGVRIASRLGIDDDPVLAGTVMDMIRLQVDGLWRDAA